MYVVLNREKKGGDDMKKIVFMMPLFLLLFVHCKKDDTVFEEETVMVPVTFELPISQAKSDFSNMFPTGDIDWGNENHVEYMYLAVGNTYSYYDQATNTTIKIGEMVELKAEVIGTADTLMFTGLVPLRTLWSSKKCSLYYFGNNGDGKEGTNVTNIYHYKKTDKCIGKRISFLRQTGSMEDLGDYHVAYYPNVGIKTLYDDNSNVVGYSITAKTLRNITSVAMFDLEGETSLKGTATQLKAYSVVWSNNNEFVTSFEMTPEDGIDVSGNVGEKSLITLLPVAEPVYVECGKGIYEFRKGIAEGFIYVGRNGSTMDDVLPLFWKKP